VDPPVARVLGCVQRGKSHRAVVGLVGASAGEPLAMGERDDDLGLVDAYRAGNVTAQRQPVLDHSVVIVEELHGIDAHLGCAVALFLGAYGARFARRNSVDAGFAMGGQQVGDCLALLHPTVHRCGETVLEVVRMRSHAEGAGPGLVEGRQDRFR